jgi:hypothetical protein
LYHFSNIELQRYLFYPCAYLIWKNIKKSSRNA